MYFDVNELLSESKEIMKESGLYNIKQLAKQYNKAIIYFHEHDLDGVTSAIAMKKYLEGYGIRTVDVEGINYGDKEYQVKKAPIGYLAVLVDFAHGKPMMHIHTDHHSNQIGTGEEYSTKFAHTRSNLEDISMNISYRDIFPPRDVEYISMHDSAQYAQHNLTPEEVSKAVFELRKGQNVEENTKYLSIAVNSILLQNKTKIDFLSDIIQYSNASLLSMYLTMLKLIKDNQNRRDYASEDDPFIQQMLSLPTRSQGKFQYVSPKDIDERRAKYIDDAKKLAEKAKGKTIAQLDSGESILLPGDIVAQYGGGNMFKAYYRYTPFVVHPTAKYLCIGWPMGLVQISKNPYAKFSNPYNLGDIAQKVLNEKYKERFERIYVSLSMLKKYYEKDAKNIESITGFTSEDVVAKYDDILKLSDRVKAVLNKPYDSLTEEEIFQLRNFRVSLWDVVQRDSGGHKDITNISSLNFYYDNKDTKSTDIIKQLMEDIVNELKSQMGVN